MTRGRLISFEGLDGSGKTTQLNLLEQWYLEQQIAYIRTREPGGTPPGSEIRSLLFQHPEFVIAPLAEAFLFQADRAQHFSELVLPALAVGTHVLTDRCFDSSIVYQGVARGVGAELVRQFSLVATQGHVPNLTILLDLDPAQVQTRTSAGRRERSRFDAETEQFHRTLRQAYLQLAREEPRRIKVLDAALPPEQIHQQVIALVKGILEL